MAETIETVPYVASDPTWQLPEADLAIFSGKRHRHVLIIPVINEGERIRRQLKAIANLAPELDIAIADGGSTDGSLDAEYLMACGVRALLVKRGSGGLSAQLRMGYAWALDQGYHGVLTMDGNGKDGVEALPSFIDALEAGVDYVQGSRYEKGGKALNTPLDRLLGVRLIHAPLISLASGRWMRDTTNGFRGYSRSLLEDDRVMPFRSVFDRYNLIFYLAISANRLGYVVRELPVERSYPDRGAVTPTKISSLMSKVALVGETLDAATGAFTPDTRPYVEGRGHWIDKLIIGLFMAMVAVLFFNFVTTPRYTADSWAYYELSKTIFDDFYRFSHFRTYGTKIEYGSSFPPLWPTLIAIVDTVFQTGARTGYGLAFAMFMAFAVMSELVGRTAFRVRWVAAGVALLTLFDDQMLFSEIAGGRSIPLQMFLFATILYVLLEKRDLYIGPSVALGALAGLAVMNRFDALPFAGVMCVGLFFLTRRLSIAVAFGIGTAVMMLPWVYYSITTFGSSFKTDNGDVALAVDASAFVTDWWPVPRLTVFDDPGGWVEKVIGNLSPFYWSIRSIIGLEMGVAILLSVVLAGTFVFLTSQARATRFDRPTRHALLRGALSSHQVRVFALILLAFSVQLSTYIVTGYFDSRYFAPILWLGTLIGAGLFVQWGRSVAQRRILALFCFGLLSALTLAGWSFNSLLLPPNTEGDQSTLWASFEQPEIISRLDACLTGTPVDTRLLVVGNNRLAARLGALAGRRSMMEPRNMQSGRLDVDGAREFLKEWRVGYVLVARSDRVKFVQTTFPVLPVPNCDLDLYRVD